MSRCLGRSRGCCSSTIVRTVAELGWTGKRNSELLQLAATDFDALLTADQNLGHQQNLGALPVAVIVLMPKLLETLRTLAPRQLVRAGV